MDGVYFSGASMPSFSKLNKDIRTDTLIVGGGLCGILCGYMLKNAGVESVIAEANVICGRTTKNTTAKITSMHGMIYSKLIKMYGKEFAALYYRANQEALEKYVSLSDIYKCDLKRCDAFIYSTDSANRLSEELSLARSIGIGCHFVKVDELPFEVKASIRFKDQASFDPLMLSSAIASDLHIYEHTRIKEIRVNEAITYDGAVIKADRIIIATHFPIINKIGGYFLKMYQSRSYTIALSGTPSLSGMYLDEKDGGLSLRSHNDLLLLGGIDARTGSYNEGWGKLERCAAELYPNAEIVSKSAAEDCMTLDGVPYIGRYSLLSKDLYVATGFNKWGMTSSMIAATLLCDMMLGKKNGYEKVFSPRRSIIHKQLFINTFESAKGLLKLKVPRCSHLGCALTWNKSEHTWDCSCHGSRFDKEGRVLDGPANKGL